MMRVLAAVAFFTPLAMVLIEGWPEGVDTTFGRIFLFAFLQACMSVLTAILVAMTLEEDA